MSSAASIIVDVRDLIGDPTYASDGTPQPGADGQFLRAQTIVRWINQAQAIIGQALKGVEDWTAFPAVPNQDVYSLDPRYFNLESGILCYDGWQTEGPPLVSEADMLPVQNLVTGMALSWAISRTAPPLRIRMWPAPDRTPGSGFLDSPIGPDDPSLTVADASSFGVPGSPNYGWLRIGKSELVRYQLLDKPNRLFSVLTRGEGGTRQLSFKSGTLVEEANIWIKGHRLPTPVGIPVSATVGSQNPVPELSNPDWQSGSFSLTLTEQLEIPDYVTHLIVEWCCRRARIKEEDGQAGDALLKNFADALTVAKKAQRRPRIGQAKLAGAGAGLWYGRVIVR